MARAFLLVIDSVGIGGAPDADTFFNEDRPDTGANTVGHIAQACARGEADEGRSGPLSVPNMDAMGLGAALKLASGAEAEGLGAAPTGLWGAATEVSRGKDTPSGHWEIAGLPVPFDWTYFPDEDPAFPPDLIAALEKAAGTGLLGLKHASGTVVLEELGAEHIATGKPIVYTSADSVVQIAAHEEHFGLERLLDMCRAVAPMLHERRVGRVIARPFIGSAEEGFSRTVNRRDFALEPPKPTLLDWAHDVGRKVHAIGKIGDIFAHRGVDTLCKGTDDQLFDCLLERADSAGAGDLVFANFVEFDSKYGHRRDVAGYARHLEWFDARLPELFAKMGPDDLMIITADHGNDPTWSGTDHTRERVPVIGYGLGAKPVGQVAYSDIGASVAQHLGLSERGAGKSFL
ncbi:MAG: phosphopentomutase [Rhodobacterales bacterium]|nr:MAG: phosphopentomutase [Rhodobacterales bacterium]